LSHNADEYRSNAAEQTAAILRKMGTVNVGDTLSNFAFEDIDGELHLLQEILTDRTLISYMKPDCDGCLVEMERLRDAADGPDDYEQVLIISSANPLHLQKLREDFGLGCLMLYDEERYFGSALKIFTYPFNLVVDRNRVILETHGNVMLPDDYKRLFSNTSHPEPVEGSMFCRSKPGWPELGEGQTVSTVGPVEGRLTSYFDKLSMTDRRSGDPARCSRVIARSSGLLAGATRQSRLLWRLNHVT
jgi:peroxiredoxin